MPPELKPPPVEATPKLAMSSAEALTTSVQAFFSPEETETLRKLTSTLVPPLNGHPGAAEANVSEFLDFLIAKSPRDRQILYRQGLHRLDGDARRRFGKPFAALDARQIADVLVPLKSSWTPSGPSDQFARFLETAKEDTLTATVNSREWASSASSGRRGGRGVGTYWYALD